jgi:hypothetical protein
MQTIFHPADREAIARRLATLEPEAQRQWGRMDAAQMLAHCAVGLEVAAGERSLPQAFLGKLIGPLVGVLVLGQRPFGHDAPTAPAFVVLGARDFEAERIRVATLIDHVVQRGPEHAAQQTHPFFGRLSGEKWGRLVYKHLDHHLRQFGV